MSDLKCENQSPDENAPEKTEGSHNSSKFEILKILKLKSETALSNQEVQSGLAHTNPIPAIQSAWLPRFEANHIIDHSAIDRAKVLEHKTLSFPPNAGMAARYLGLRIEAREIYFGENIRQRIRGAHQIAVPLQKERSVQFRRATHD